MFDLNAIPALLQAFRERHPKARDRDVDDVMLAIGETGSGSIVASLAQAVERWPNARPEELILADLRATEESEVRHWFDDVAEALEVLSGRREPNWIFDDEIKIPEEA